MHSHPLQTILKQKSPHWPEWTFAFSPTGIFHVSQDGVDFSWLVECVMLLVIFMHICMFSVCMTEFQVKMWHYCTLYLGCIKSIKYYLRDIVNILTLLSSPQWKWQKMFVYPNKLRDYLSAYAILLPKKLTMIIFIRFMLIKCSFCWEWECPPCADTSKSW